VTTDVERLEAIKTRLSAMPPRPYFWRGNADYPESLYLGAPSWNDADGNRHFGRNVLSLVHTELTERDARVRHVGECESEDVRSRPLRDKDDIEVGVTFGNGFDVPFEPEDTYDGRYEAAYERAVKKTVADATEQWLTDEYGEPRIEHRLAFTDADGFLIEATKLGVYEVAPQATVPDDPKVYRRDITGFRHPAADFFAAAADDMAILLAEVERLTTTIDTIRTLSVDAWTGDEFRDCVDRLLTEPTTGWPPGDPCQSCGSRETILNDDNVPACTSCGKSDADE
jgi:hypothetical protein